MSDPQRRLQPIESTRSASNSHALDSFTSEGATTAVSNTAATSSSAAEPIINLAGALARLDNRRKLLADLMAFFLEDAPTLLSSIESALVADDLAEVRRASHSLKGLASNFDAGRCASAALQVEQLAAREERQRLPASISLLQQEVSLLIEVLNVEQPRLVK